MAAYVLPLNFRAIGYVNCVCASKVLKYSKCCARLQNVRQQRFYHAPRNHSPRYLLSRQERRLVQPNCKVTNIFGLAAIRLASTSPEVTSGSKSVVLDPIPEPPVPLPPPIPQGADVTSDIVETVAAEPSFASIGLGGWSPVGIVQNCLEYLHVTCDIPWWGAIVIGTAVVRMLIFPLVIVSQRNAAKMNNYMPQLQIIQMKMTDARQTGDSLEAARLAQELGQFMKEKKLNPLKNLVVPLAQAPLFISFFIGLRQMANVPVESMMNGGLFWFTDLTVPDQYYLLPVLTSLTLYITIYIGTDAARLNSANLGLMRYVLQGLPLFILPFTINFPGAILCYWLSSNFISLLQTSFLRIPAVRDYCKIERMVTHDKNSLPTKPKGFVEGVKESWKNMQITRELEDRQRFDEIQFNRAGRAPIKKTYKVDPTRIIEDIQKPTVIGKKRD